MSNVRLPRPDPRRLGRELEQVDLVDEEGNSIGQDTVAAAHTAPGELHRAFSVMLFDDQQRVLVQQRALSKTRFAGVWGPSCCGHPSSAATLETDAARRIQEELGVGVAGLRVIGHTSYIITSQGDGVEREYDHILVGSCAGEPTPDPAEVAAVRWFTLEELRKNLAEGDVPYGEWLAPVVNVVIAWQQDSNSVLPGMPPSPGSRRSGIRHAQEGAPMAQPQTFIGPITSTHEEQCFEYWDNKRDDTINLQPGTDDYVHSHFSVIDYDHAVLDAPPESRERAILEELHRIENVQVDKFIDSLGPLDAGAAVLDNGCGRGGTVFRLHERYGCAIDGVDFSTYRLGFARDIAEQRGCSDLVHFFRGNMTDTGRPANHYDAVICNEAAEHLEDVEQMFPEIARLLKPAGRFALATWVANDVAGQRSDEVAKINANYVTRISTRAANLRGMVSNGLIPLSVQDLTSQAIPYFELRSHSAHRTGVETPFLSAFRRRLMNYLFIVAEYQPTE